jgi:hypothetical protein
MEFYHEVEKSMQARCLFYVSGLFVASSDFHAAAGKVCISASDVSDK